MSLGTQIKEARTALDLTQEALAEALGVVPQTVSKWERDESQPDAALLPGLADALQTSLDTLFQRETGTQTDAEKALLRWLRDADDKEQMAGVQELMGFCWKLLEGCYDPKSAGRGPFDDPLFPTLDLRCILLGDEGLALWQKNDKMPLGLFIGEGRGWLPWFEDPDELAGLWEVLADPAARRSILLAFRSDSTPFDRAEAARILGAEDTDGVIDRLCGLNVMSRRETVINGEKTTLYCFIPNNELLALLLLAKAVYRPFLHAGMINAGGRERTMQRQPPLRKRE